ncbi:MAG: thioredoxin-dependent thiol peroxidase [Tidjanibacter sp.]|nr:thioredoxin-dependent thiol peroxidase [Tidjanibacter sp.]
MLKIGQKAPNFEGITQGGKSIKLSDFEGRKLILYFYPKDNTSGCTLEAKSMQEGKEQLRQLGFEIVGVSPDSVKSHENFCSKHSLEFPLIADTKKEIATNYGVWQEKSMYGRKYMGIVRTTFIIDEKGHILHIFDKVKTSTHWQQIAQWWEKAPTKDELLNLYDNK